MYPVGASSPHPKGLGRAQLDIHKDSGPAAPEPLIKRKTELPVKAWDVGPDLGSDLGSTTY